jgi:hypothetical protein
LFGKTKLFLLLKKLNFSKKNFAKRTLEKLEKISKRFFETLLKNSSHFQKKLLAFDT